MKIDTYEVPVGTNGVTVRVNTVNIFDDNNAITEDQNINTKKIKTTKEKVVRTGDDFSKAIATALNITRTHDNSIVEEEPRMEMPEIGNRYSFETAIETPAAVAYQKPTLQEAYRGDTMTQYNKLYDKLDPVEKLRADFEKTEVGSYAHKVLKIGIAKVSKYDNLLEENDRTHVALEEELKAIQAKLEANKKERNAIETEKRENATIVSDAYKQACQLDAYDKATKEAEIKREQEEAARKAQQAAEQRAAAARRAEMLARIPSELQEEPAKTPVSVKNGDAFNRFKDVTESIGKFDFSKGGRAA